MLEATDNAPRGAVIKVVGVGGGGGNAIRHMVDSTVCGVDFCAINTDVQDLRKLGPEVTCLEIGKEFTTKGLGAGADPNIGRAAAEESKEDIAQFLQHTNMLFIAAGMGGGTGTGAAPVVAAIAKELNILTVAVVTKPFKLENRSAAAKEGLVELGKHVDTIIVVANDKLLKMDASITLLSALAAANDVLLGAVQGIADLITRSGLINVDFADVQTVMLGKGNAMMGTGMATGENRAEIATRNAIKSPLLEDIALNSAKGLLVNITADESLRIAEFNKINKLIRENYAAKDAQIVMGTATDENMNGAIKVTVVATGVFAGTKIPQDARQASQDTQQALAGYVPTANDNAQPLQPAATEPPQPKQPSKNKPDWDEFKNQAAFLRR